MTPDRIVWALSVLEKRGLDIPTALAASASVGIEEGMSPTEALLAYADVPVAS